VLAQRGPGRPAPQRRGGHLSSFPVPVATLACQGWDGAGRGWVARAEGGGRGPRVGGAGRAGRRGGAAPARYGQGGSGARRRGGGGGGRGGGGAGGGGVARAEGGWRGPGGASGRVGAGAILAGMTESLTTTAAGLRLRGGFLPVLNRARVYCCGITPYDVTHL